MNLLAILRPLPRNTIRKAGMLAALSFLLVNSSATEPASNCPRVALVLSGGAARGAAHVGVLKVLEDNRIPVDFVAGTSMGAIVGGMYASGLSPQQMDQILTSTDWNDLFTDRPARKRLSFRQKQDDYESLIKVEMGWKNGRLTLPSCLIAGDKLMFYLRRLTLQTQTIATFDQLAIPFRAVATDLENGDMVVLEKGDLAEAMRASMAIPGAFAPQEIDGRLLVDGFLTQNLPVSVALATGADLIIAVDVGAPLYTRDELKSILKFSGQSLGMMSRRNTREQVALLRTNDVLIQPNLGSIRGLSFDKSAEAISLGATATKNAVERLKQYSLSEENYREWVAARRRSLTEKVRVDAVRVVNDGRVPAKTIEKRVGIEPGTEVKVDELRGKLDRVYDIGAFDVVDYKIANDSGTNTLVINPHEKSTGRIHVRTGLQLSSDMDTDSDFNFRASVTMTELNSRGAEWKNQVQFGRTARVFSEFYQPVNEVRSLFVAPSVQFLQDKAEGMNADGGLFRAKYRRFDTGLDLGSQLGNFGEIRVGPSFGTTKAYDVRGLTLPGGVSHVTQAGARARLSIDQFDNVNFPRHGYAGGLDLYSSQQALGADLDYSRLSGGYNHAFSFGENTFLGGFNFGGKLGPDLPFYENFSLGGFLNLSGYPFEGISDQYYGLGRLVYYRRILKFKNRAVEGLYFGGSLEAGGVWHRIEDVGSRGLMMAGSAFIGVDTMFGPLYLAYGHAEEGNHAFYFYLGRGF